MEKNVPTILKSLLQTCHLLGKDYPILPNSTINQKLSILVNNSLNPGERPIMKYAMIGIGGLSVQTGADGFTYTQAASHRPGDTGLFREIPFLMRPIDSDITAQQRANYRLRKIETRQGFQYFAYYGKALTLGDIPSVLQKRTVQNDGSVSSVTHTPSTGDLSPSPVIIASNQTVTTTNTYLVASTKVDFILTPEEITNIVQAAEILYGIGQHAVITEIAFCSGVDRTVSVTDGGVAIPNLTEAICVQVMSFLSTNFPAASINQGIKYTFDIGNAEPLLELA